MEYFLWPQPTFSFVKSAVGKKISIDDIEKEFSNLYTDSHPVLFSSGRAAIRAILKMIGLSRPSRVSVPDYASHCVLDAVARVATPSVDGRNDEVDCVLLNHQWGYEQQTSFTGDIIEDSVDSLCEPGFQFFKNGGRFEIISLPKIFGCLCGGVVFCRDEADAASLKVIRDRCSRGMWTQFLLKSLSTQASGLTMSYWQGYEAENGLLPSMVCRQIRQSLQQINSIIKDRKFKIEIVKHDLLDGLILRPGRLPSNIPFDFQEVLELKFKQYGITTGLRHIKGKPCLPLPIHRDVPSQVVEQLSRQMKRIENVNKE